MSADAESHTPMPNGKDVISIEPLYSVSIPTNAGDKTIAVFQADILAFDGEIDILTASAFLSSYQPTPGTLFHALSQVGIPVPHLAADPEIDLRSPCNVWLSKPIGIPELHIRRLGCVEMQHDLVQRNGVPGLLLNQREMLNSIKAYFQMLELAAIYGVKMDTVALPILGAGRQQIAADLVLIPLINECVQFLKRSSAVKRIYFIERNRGKACRVAQLLKDSYAIKQDASAPRPTETERHTRPLAFISYSSKDKNVADNLCAKLEARGVQVWYAPRDIHKDYATAIAEAILRATHFIVILSKNSMESEHVLNEIDLAFKRLPDRITFKPLRIDDHDFAPAFDYYLSRQHWMDAYLPPLELRLTEFADELIRNLPKNIMCKTDKETLP